MIASMTESLSPEGYWPSGMDEYARKNSMDAFERAIYPIWASIEKSAIETDDAMTQEQTSQLNVLLECPTMHHQDLAIRASGIQPRMNAGDQQKIADLRRRSSRAFGA